MITPDYTNKMEPQPRIIHKTCKGKAKRVMGGGMWCEKCGKYVDSVECRYVTEVKSG